MLQLYRVSWCGLSLLLICIVISAVSARAEETTQLISFHGEVTRLPSGQHEWQRVTTAIALQAGDSLRTGARSRAEVAFPGGVVRMYEQTLLKLPDDARPLSAGSTDTQRTVLTHGRSMFKVLKRSLGNSFEVITPSLVVGVKGTVFRVVEELQRRSVEVFEGRVWVSAQDQPQETVELDAFQMTLLRDGHLMPVAPVDKSDLGWEDWEAGSPTDAALSEERFLEQRLQDRMDDRLRDLLESSRDLQQEIQTGSVRLPALQDHVVPLDSFRAVPLPPGALSTISGPTGTVTGIIEGQPPDSLTDFTGPALPTLLP